MAKFIIAWCNYVLCILVELFWTKADCSECSTISFVLNCLSRHLEVLVGYQSPVAIYVFKSKLFSFGPKNETHPPIFILFLQARPLKGAIRMRC